LKRETCEENGVLNLTKSSRWRKESRRRFLGDSEAIQTSCTVEGSRLK